MAELRALATTDMADQVIADLLLSESGILDWQVGEALAEALLERSHGAVWPWNSARDRKTPKASLPGADLVGFVVDALGPALLFGEVKTSADACSPPNVVYGRSGLTKQIENLTTDHALHWALLKWLQTRCKEEPLLGMWRGAVARFVNSGGHDFRLIGCLMRDLEPNEADLRSRGEVLGAAIEPPLGSDLIAWYLPETIDKWPQWVEGSPQ